MYIFVTFFEILEWVRVVGSYMCLKRQIQDGNLKSKYIYILCFGVLIHVDVSNEIS